MKNQNGFTLIEILITIGIILIVGGMASVIDINVFRGDSFRSEVSSIGTAMQTARANSFNNINQKKHGVAFFPNGSSDYVIFEGDNYLNRDVSKDIVIKSSYKLNFGVGSPTEVVFDQLSGNANYNGKIILIDPNRGISMEIETNHEGKISW